MGNRLTQTADAVATTFGYAPGSNRLASIKTGATTQTVGTTAAGNIKTFSPALGAVTNLTYNQANRLATTSSGATLLTQYTYDAFGYRLVKVGSATSTTLFQYDQAGRLLEETDGTGSPQVDYIYLGDRPVANFQPSNGKLYFLHDDRLGTPQVATDSAQAIAWTANYQPFGYTSTSAGIIAQDLRLPGQEFEVETGFNHNGFRDYAPTLGRYLESDPIGLRGRLNTYGYVNQNPINFTDPSGKDAKQTLQVLACLLVSLCAPEFHAEVDLKDPTKPVSITTERAPEDALGDVRKYIDELPNCPDPQTTTLPVETKPPLAPEVEPVKSVPFRFPCQ